MDCGVCEVRSSDGYCITCKTLLCPECASPCEHCHKPICPQHLHETGSGRLLCEKCLEELRAHKTERHATRHEAKEASKRHHSADEMEPLYLASGYRPPSKPVYAVAITVFLVVGLALLFNWSLVRDCMRWPLETGKSTFETNQTLVIQETNRLRNFSNISKLNVGKIGFFCVTWVFLAAYFIGLLATAYSLIHSLLFWYQRSKERQKAQENSD